ncbi:glycine-rich domain-containing protein [Achromobacter xylosoxidans]|jgi:hypothetical protein|uniref:glycine-rich domain-containing protein n=1 Tax=Alcaligenes xylosoxydans xylosoxydans TaxID=85698 RepID=UPI0006C4310B|nr:hypothetical protein [Achromobacter xylosoxidans]CUJ51273.1 Uncharacterised protein [Achromobacter xylosoxidans]
MATRIYKTPFAATGDKEPLATADQPDGKVSLQAGWTPDYELPNDNANYRPVGRAEMNGVISEITEGLGDVQLNGFATWQAIDGGWPNGALVSHGGLKYQSMTASNVTTPGVAGSDWEPAVTTVGTLPLASTSVVGIVELATTAETTTGADTTRAVTPGALAAQFPIRGHQIYNTAGSHTWNVPSGVTRVRVTVIGGGGGGGGAFSPSGAGASGGGGGGGAYGVKLVDLTGVATVPVTVGAGGSGGISNTTNPTSGGSSSFGTYVSASGGFPGGNGSSGPANGGAGGNSTTGADYRGSGQGGATGLVKDGVFAIAGLGGSTQNGSCYTAPNVTGSSALGANGSPGTNGAGGSGGAAYNATAAGGAGAPGFILIEW